MHTGLVVLQLRMYRTLNEFINRNEHPPMSSTQPEEMRAQLEQKINKLLAEQCLGVLATKDQDGHPYASLIAFAGNPDHSELYFVTPRATRKFVNISHDRRVALLINNTVNQPADFHEAHGGHHSGRCAPAQ